VCCVNAVSTNLETTLKNRFYKHELCELRIGQLTRLRQQKMKREFESSNAIMVKAKRLRNEIKRELVNRNIEPREEDLATCGWLGAMAKEHDEEHNTIIPFQGIETTISSKHEELEIVQDEMEQTRQGKTLKFSSFLVLCLFTNMLTPMD